MGLACAWGMREVDTWLVIYTSKRLKVIRWDGRALEFAGWRFGTVPRFFYLEFRTGTAGLVKTLTIEEIKSGTAHTILDRVG